jgi:hypothetical protein
LLLGFLLYITIQFKVRNIFRKIKRLIAFIPIIWKGDDFDYHYAIDLFKFQLSRLADYIEKNDRYVGSENDVARIRLVCRLMTKVYDEEYTTHYQEILRAMYGENVLNFDFEKNERGYSILTYEYEKWENAEEINQIKDELFTMSQEKQERAHRLLWQLIEKDIRKWWD